MYVILTQEVAGLGKKHSLQKVKDGYFSNFLEPRGVAKIATEDLLEHLKEEIALQKLEAAKVAQAMSEQGRTLSSAVLEIAVKASEKGTLFKALSAKDIVMAIKKQLSMDVEKTHVEMEPLKKIGDATVKVQIGGEVVTVKVHIQPKAHDKKTE